jgi:hypothetical protein
LRIPEDRSKAADLPIVCSLPADEIARRRTELLPALVEKAVAIDRVDNGVRLTFDAASGLLGELADVIDRERQCCQFFRFHLTVSPGLGPILLEVSGPPGAAEFLESLLP